MLPPRVLPLVPYKSARHFESDAEWEKYFAARLDYLASKDEYDQWSIDHPVLAIYHGIWKVFIYFLLPIGAIVFAINMMMR